MSEKILKLPEVMATTGLSRSSIYSFISEGTFPAQVGLGARAVGFLESEILEWIQQKADQRRAK